MTSRKSASLQAGSGGQSEVSEGGRCRRYLEACRAIAEVAGCPPLLEKIATDVLPRIVSDLAVDGGTIHSVGEQGASCSLFAHFGLPPEGVTALSDSDPRDLAGGRVFSRPSMLQAETDSLLRDLGFASGVLVPLGVVGECTGALLLLSHQGRTWGEDELLLLEALGVQLSSSLATARLYERFQREDAQLRAVSTVALSVGAAELDEVLKAALASALELVDLESGGVLLVDERSQSVRVRVAQGWVAELALRVPPISVEDGLTGQAVRTGQIVVSEDVPSDERVAFDMLREGGFRTVVVIPLTGRDHVVGSMNLVARESVRFDSEDLSFLQAIGNQMGMVIENAQLYAQTRQRLEHLSAVHDTVLDVVGRLDMTGLLQAIVERATTLLRARGGCLALHHPEKKELEVVVSHQLRRDHMGLVLSTSTGLSGVAILSGEPAVTSDYRADFSEPRSGPDAPPKAAIAVPLRWGDSVLGVLDLVDDADGRTFDDDDVRALQIFAAHAAIALQNAHMYAEIKRRFDESQALLKVAQAMVMATSLQDLLDLIVKAAVETIPGAESSVIHLLDPEASELSIGATSRRTVVLLDPGAGAMKVGQGIAGHAIREGCVINVPDADQDTRFVRFPKSHSFKSLLVAPLILGKQKLGTLSVDSEADNAFGTDDERLLTLLSAQASAAIANARLREETAGRSRELREAYSALREMALMKDEFVARVSHELKSPLAPMRIAVERTLSEAFGSVNSAQREMLEIALVNVDRLNVAVTELLDVVRLSARSEETVQQTFDLRTVAEESVRAMRPKAKARDIRLEVEVPEMPVLVLANQRRIGQVILNLLSNALKFNRQLGEVRLCIRRVDDGWAEVSVTDTGIGIPQGALDSLFSRFYQVESPLTREYEGLGLGLAIAKGNVELDGGTIWVESEEGKGSKFTFTVPLA